MASVTAGAIAGLASAGASAYSASAQAGAAGKAAKTLQPFTDPGRFATIAAGNSLGLTDPTHLGGVGAFQGSPGFQWQLQQGMDAIQNSASAQGGVVSGNTLKALQTYGQGLANQDWYNYLHTLLNLGGLGENAAAGVGNAFMNQGNAQAAGTVGTTNALTNILPFLLGGSNPGGGSPVGSNGVLQASNVAGFPVGDTSGLSFIGQVG